MIVEDLRSFHDGRGGKSVRGGNRVRISRVRIVDEGRVIGHLQLRLDRLRIRRREPFGAHSFRTQQLD